MRTHEVAGKRILVLGLGVHGGGVAVARWLVRHGARVTVSDAKSRVELASSLKQLTGLPIRYVLGRHPASLLASCDLIVQNPGVPRTLPLLQGARRRGISIENEASLFLKWCATTLVVGVTGSKGKSTTTALLGAMLKRWDKRTLVAGNIRDTVMFDVLNKVTPSTPVVLELSSWHLEQVLEHNLRVPLAVITNVTPEHLNRYPSFASYARAKAGIVRHQRAEDVAVLNYDNSVTKKFGARAPGAVYWFSLKKRVRGVSRVGERIMWRDGSKAQELFRVSDVRIPGEHNLANAMAAATAARAVGVPATAIRAAIRSFTGLHDRLEYVRTVHGVTYINDTTSTSPQATQAALHALASRQVVLIAGGVDKNLPYNSLARDVRRYMRALVLLPGSATVKLQRALRGFKHQLLARSMPEAVKLARTLVPPNGVVLLSPGAASFNLFKHEFDRGEAFRRAVRAL